MSSRKLCLMVVACSVVLSLLWSVLGSQAVKGECCQTRGFGGTLELKWDDGVPLDRVSYGCGECLVYQGVQFTLPAGLSHAILRGTRLYAGTGEATLFVSVTDGSFNYLLDPLPFQVNGSVWYDVPLPEVEVPKTFYVWIKVPMGSAFSQPPAAPFYDGIATGHSVFTDRPGVSRYEPTGDLMIRAVIVPEVHVGPGQDYGTIQGAVNSVGDGWTIIVHEGTYTENVTVHKSVTIRSLSGPEQTTVRAPQVPYPARDVFRVTADCAAVSGFTIRGAAVSGGGGVRIDQADSCTVSGNLITNNDYGLYVSENSTSNILLENQCTSNTHGVYVEGSRNYIMGNRIDRNVAVIGSEVFLSGKALRNQLRFNIMTPGPGANGGVAVFNQSTAEDVSGLENWWGAADGPANAGGVGPKVGDRVLFEPWLKVEPLRVRTFAACAGEFAVNAREETSVALTMKGTGAPVVSVATFGENPAGQFPSKSMGKWLDVLLDDSSGVENVEIRVYYTPTELGDLDEGSLRLFWWDGDRWRTCSSSGVDKEEGFVWARLDPRTNPAATDLVGTFLEVGESKGGFRWWTVLLVILVIVILLIAFRLLWVLIVKRGREV